MPESRIEDYGLIGDCETAALVGRDGSIDWLCWPRFDSDACFAALLGDEENGRWRLAPAGEATASRRYRPGTLILETRWETPEGAVVVSDFMPPRGTCSDVVRMVAGESGSVAMRSELTLRFGYGRVVPWVSRLPDGSLRAIAGPDMVVLRTAAETHGADKHTVSDFVVSAGETISFVLTYEPSHKPLPKPISADAALAETEAFWTEWSSRFDAGGDAALPDGWREPIQRSLITLKALTYAPTGGIVAAPTTSLPEWIGGTRNWDYRFCWLRDAAITLLALMTAGYKDEATAWRDWLVRAMAGSAEDMQIMYGVAGERRIPEWEVPWLPGFDASPPVRVGNAAHDQRQLDVFGEVALLLHEARLGGLPEDAQAWALERHMLEVLEEIWREPDEGIWEVRGGRKHFTFSKVMAWAAFDRGIQSSERFDLDEAPLEHWRRVRDDIHADVCANGFDPGIGSFVQAYGERHLDASLLLLPLLGFLPYGDPRIVGTIEAIERDLVVEGFVRRYDTEECGDGLPPGEGTFLACSFWLVSAYAGLGRVDEARRLFERLLAVRNDLGLMSEEFDPISGHHLGNFPQAFSHVAQVNAAYGLARVLAGGQAQRVP